MISRHIYLRTFVVLSSILLLSAAPDRKRWKRTFEPGEDRKGTPSELISGSGGNHRSTECRDGYITTVAYDSLSGERSKRGSRSHSSGVDVLAEHPCSTSGHFTLRHYPTWDGHFKLPVLVMFWMYVDAPDWQSMTGDRFSQSTLKGRFPVDGQIITTHILPDGTMDIGHSDMSFQSKSIKVPLNRWNLQSMYIENKNGKTLATLLSDREVAVKATCRATWGDGELRHWHMGLYGDNNSVVDTTYPNTPFNLFNDDIQIIEVGGYDEALGFIQAELGDLIVDSTPPAAPRNVEVVIDR